MHASEPHDDRLLRWLIAVCGLAVLAAHGIASIRYSNWTWGFHHFYFLPRPVTLVLLGTAAILCLPPIETVLSRVSTRLGARLPGPRPSPMGTAVLAAVLAALLFALFRTRTHFLGDGRLVIRLLNEGAWFHPYEPLDRLVHYGVLAISRPIFGWDGAAVYAAVSVVAGAIYVFFAFRLGQFLGRTVFIPAFLLSLGAVVLFFGYAESYALPSAAVLAYGVLALETLDGRRRRIWPALVLAIAIALHLSLLVLLPSLLVLMFRGRTGVVASAIASAGTAAGALLIFSRTADRAANLFVPLVPAPVAQYTLFSAARGADLLNELILLQPLGFAAACVLAMLILRRRTGDVVRFRSLALMAGVPFILGLLLRPGLGGGRDWDLWSLPFLPALIVTGVSLSRRMTARRWARTLGWVVVIVGIVHTLPRVVVLTNERLGCARFERMLEDNPLWTEKRLAAAQADMGTHYLDHQDPGRAVEFLRAAVRTDPTKARYWNSLGAAELQRRQFRLAETALLGARQTDPAYTPAAVNLARLYRHLHRIDDAWRLYREAVRAQPENVAFRVEYAEFLEESNRSADALAEWREIVRLTAERRAERSAFEKASARIQALSGRRR